MISSNWHFPLRWRSSVWALFGLMCCVGSTNAQWVDHRALLDREVFWDNRDRSWFLENTPAFDCPDPDIVTTYYYRWELLTKHLTYGSPDTGYVFTEFIDRPFWSGAYGAISCPAGHQLYESRWLRSPRIAKDYARYWFLTPGAQPRNYSSWLADSVVAIDNVHPDATHCQSLLPHLIANFQGWKERYYVESSNGVPVGLFWQIGHDDGMEFNIASRQTKDILRGAPSYCPSFNAYMWAEAMAIAKLARQQGQDAIADEYQKFAEGLKERVINQLWDPKRRFFLIRYKDDEEAEGFQVKANSFIYETGRFAGDAHGRELIGYVPWQFGLLGAGTEHDIAWAKLMDRDGFYADFGPSTVERKDPMFLLMKSCCWWSGQSWPFATTQTLKALAVHLQNGGSPYVDRQDYLDALRIYARSHRKEGKPYLAEALHPDTGSFEGHDGYNHSEHYFHSGYIDLIITGLVGIIPSDSNTLRIHPLAPADWNYMILDRVRYRDHDVSIVWDRKGDRYSLGAGLHVLCDGTRIAHATEMGPITVTLPETRAEGGAQVTMVNHMVNNDGNYFPRLTASSTAAGSSIAKLQDGNYWYMQHPPNRWLHDRAQGDTVTMEVDLGMPRAISELKLYFLDDEGDAASPVRAPESITVEALDGSPFRVHAIRSEEKIEGHRPTTLTLDGSLRRSLRIQVKAIPGQAIGLTEIEVWGTSALPYPIAPPPKENLAFRAPDREFPKTSASHSDRFGGVATHANDGKTIFTPTPLNRWTSYESKTERDWLAIDFGKEVEFNTVDLAIYDDRGGVQAPEAYHIEYWTQGVWRPVTEERHNPQSPVGSQWNQARFATVKSDQLRIVFKNKEPAKSGVTEVMVFLK